MCALAGSYMSICYAPMWQENMTAGRGWIALALVVFATWKPKNFDWCLHFWWCLNFANESSSLGFKFSWPIL